MLSVGQEQPKLVSKAAKQYQLPRNGCSQKNVRILNRQWLGWDRSLSLVATLRGASVARIPNRPLRVSVCSETTLVDEKCIAHHV